MTVRELQQYDLITIDYAIKRNFIVSHLLHDLVGEAYFAGEAQLQPDVLSIQRQLQLVALMFDGFPGIFPAAGMDVGGDYGVSNAICRGYTAELDGVLQGWWAIVESR